MPSDASSQDETMHTVVKPGDQQEVRVDGEQPNTEDDHDHTWFKEGPVAHQGSTGRSFYIIYTCESDSCEAWKYDLLGGNNLVSNKKEDQGSNIIRPVQKLLKVIRRD